MNYSIKPVVISSVLRLQMNAIFYALILDKNKLSSIHKTHTHKLKISQESVTYSQITCRSKCSRHPDQQKKVQTNYKKQEVIKYSSITCSVKAFIFIALFVMSLAYRYIVFNRRRNSLVIIQYFKECKDANLNWKSVCVITFHL